MALAVTALALALPGTASAATFAVNTTADTTTPGGCTTDPVCSLRDAVTAANALGGGGATINVPAGTYTLTSSTNGDGLRINGAGLEIAGAGAGQTVIRGNGGFRVFDVLTPGSPTPTNPELTLRNLTVTGGVAPAAGLGVISQGDGGGILNQNHLTLDHVAVTGNSATLGGGGMFSPFEASGALTTTTVSDSLIANNQIAGGGGNGQGGGMAIFGNLSLTNTTVSGNSVAGTGVTEGGGIVTGTPVLASARATASLLNTTIANNTVSGPGGASDFGGGVSGDNIGGAGLTSDLTTKNTLIAGNTVDGSKQNCSLLTLVSTSHNLSGDASCGFSDPGSLQNTDPKLGPLADNGGPTQTQALPDRSPAINAGDNAGCPGTDQRGTKRPQDVVCDIGAFEAVVDADLALKQKVVPHSVSDGENVNYTLTLTNHGPFTADGVILTGGFPRIVRKFDPTGTCKVKKRRTKNHPHRFKRMLDCAIGTVAPNQTVKVKLRVKATNVVRRLRNTAEVSSLTPDSNPANNSLVGKVKLKG